MISSIFFSVLLFIGGDYWNRDNVIQTLEERAIYHNASPAEVISVARCETGNTFSPYLTGGLGEKGIGQWLPGRGNHWDRTPAWKIYRIDIVQEYRSNNPDAVWLDIDMLAWSFGYEAQTIYPGNKRGWSCY